MSQREAGICYYNNSGQGSTITRELVANLFEKLEEHMSSDYFRDFVSRSRVPNERELYGLFVRSLLESTNSNIDHVATEFQVQRCEGDDGVGTKGRVDLFFNYRSVSYLVELKVGRINARGEDRDPKKRARKIWKTAIQQLNDLTINSVDGLLEKKIVKLPIAIYFFDSTKLVDGHESIDFGNLHDRICSFIECDEDGLDIKPDFHQFRDIPHIDTRLRKTNVGEECNNYIYGFSFFGKQM